MTQISSNIDLTSTNLALNFESFEKPFPKLCYPYNSISTLAELNSTLHNSHLLNQISLNPTPFTNQSPENYEDEPVKKIKTNSSLPSIQFPDKETKKSQNSKPGPFRIHKEKPVKVNKPMDMANQEDCIFTYVGGQLVKLSPEHLEQELQTKAQKKRNKEMLSNEKNSATINLKQNMLLECLKKHETSSFKDVKLTERKNIFNINKSNRKVKQINRSSDQLNLYANDKPQRVKSVETVHIPQFKEPTKESDIPNMQDALELLKSKMLTPHQQDFELPKSVPQLKSVFQPIQEEVPIGFELPASQLIDNLTMFNYQYIDNRAVTDALLNELFLVALYGGFEPGRQQSIFDLFENNTQLANSSQIYNFNQQNIKQEENIVVIDDDEEDIVVVNKPIKELPKVRETNESSVSTTPSSKAGEDDKEKSEMVSELEEVQNIVEIKQVTSSENIKIIAADKGIKNEKAVKVGCKVMWKKNLKNKKVKNFKGEVKKTRKAAYRLRFASKRIQNKWQLARTGNINRQYKQIEKQIEAKGTKVILVASPQEEITETPVGPKHQVEKFPEHTPNPRRGAPKLRWNPSVLEENELKNYFKRLGEILKCEINEEKAIKLLREAGNDPKNVYKNVEGKEREFMREFIVRPRRDSKLQSFNYKLF